MCSSSMMTCPPPSYFCVTWEQENLGCVTSLKCGANSGRCERHRYCGWAYKCKKAEVTSDVMNVCKQLETAIKSI